MPKFIPLSTLKDTTFICDMCQQIKEPIFVTRNGTPEMVIMDAEFFDNYLSPYIIDGEIDVVKVLEYMPLFINIKALKNIGDSANVVQKLKMQPTL